MRTARAADVTLVNTLSPTHIWPFLFNHLRDWFRWVTSSSKEGDDCCFKYVSLYTEEGNVLHKHNSDGRPFLPCGGDSFFNVPSVIVLSGGTHHRLQMALTSDWRKNNRCLSWRWLDYCLSVGWMFTLKNVGCSRTNASGTLSLMRHHTHQNRRSFPRGPFQLCPPQTVKEACKQKMPRHKSTRKTAEGKYISCSRGFPPRMHHTREHTPLALNRRGTRWSPPICTSECVLDRQNSYIFRISSTPYGFVARLLFCYSYQGDKRQQSDGPSCAAPLVRWLVLCWSVDGLQHRPPKPLR